MIFLPKISNSVFTTKLILMMFISVNTVKDLDVVALDSKLFFHYYLGGIATKA